MSMIPMPPGATLAISTSALALNVRCETREHFDQVIRFMTSARELFGEAEPPNPTRQEAEAETTDADRVRGVPLMLDAVEARQLADACRPTSVSTDDAQRDAVTERLLHDVWDARVSPENWARSIWAGVLGLPAAVV